MPFGNETCGLLETAALKANDTECDKLQSNAAWCQCPGVEPTCTLCAGGVSPPDVDILVEEIGATCGELEYLATVAPHDTACDRIAAFASACGCPDDDKYACMTLCPDGTPVEQQQDIVGETSTGKMVTCGDVQATVANGIEEQARCNMYAQIGVYACGCDSTLLPEPACKLCENGQVPTNLLYEVDGKGNTCVEFMAELVYVDDPDACLAFQATAGVYCGCDNPVASASACRICGDSLLPDPRRIADTEHDVACSEAEYVASLGAEFCANIQTAFADICCGPEQINPHDTDQLSYSDDLYVDATSPPIARPPLTEPELDEYVGSSAKVMCARTMSIVTVLVVAALLF